MLQPEDTQQQGSTLKSHAVATEPSSKRRRALLIDLDNCPHALGSLGESLEQFNRIVVCYGGTEPKVALRVVPMLAPAICDGRLTIVSMQRPGKNAADFGLAFWAGRLVAEMPGDTQFFVMSHDNDMNHVIQMLEDAKRNVERWDRRTERVEKKRAAGGRHRDPTPGKLTGAENIAADYYVSYIGQQHSRPARRVTLMRSIRAYCQSRASEAAPEEIFERLIISGVVMLDQQERVSYPAAPGSAVFVEASTALDNAVGLPF